MTDEAQKTIETHSSPEPSDKVLTVPNVISFIRLCMAPVFFILLLNGYDLGAALLFGIAASTDFVDGQIARRTNQVSKLGQILDPAVDRILMISAVLGALIVGRLPIWIVVLVLARDAVLLIGGWYLLHEHNIRVAVVYAGKVATTFLFFGLFGLLLNTPVVEGLGWCAISWLPGFNGDPCSWGIWCVYIGLIIGLFTTGYYVHQGATMLSRATKNKNASDGAVM